MNSLNQQSIQKRSLRKNLVEVGLDHLINEIINDIQLSKLRWANKLTKIITQISTMNPYKKKDIEENPSWQSHAHLMWIEQCCINFPLLYLSSIYLYIYAKQKGCDTFLFATRDCCHWIKIFKKMFPGTNCHYFHCSRNMFKKAANEGNIAFKNYVKSLIGDDLERVIYVDIHGTGQNLFFYFEKEFGRVPHCLLLSAASLTYEKLPQICHLPYKTDHLEVLVFSAAGTPIEMLNYDLIGTLQDYTKHRGPLRDSPEYPLQFLEPYHVCMNLLIDQIQPLRTRHLSGNKDHVLIHLANLIRKIYLIIQQNVPVIETYIQHQVKHVNSV